MKFKNTAAEYQSTVNSGKKMGFAPEAESFLMDMMSDGLYSDKYGSIVRELTSNAIDANVESGKANQPVRIDLTAPNSFSNQGEIAFTDCGIGINPERIDDIFTLYFASTKRDDNEMIGGFGIGAKSPFAYTDVFRVETWSSNVKRTYLLEKRGQDRTCTLLSETPEVGCGTVIRIPIASRFDYEKFVKAVNEQTLLMRPIAVTLTDNAEYTPATVYEFDTFYIALDRHGDPVTNKVALGNVVYDHFEAIDIYRTYRGVPVIPKLEIGKVMPTMSRESLQLTDDAKTYINERFAEVVGEMQSMADSQATETDSLIEAMKGRKSHALELPDGTKFDMDWAMSRQRRVSEDLVNMKGLTYTKFPKAPLGEVASYCSMLLEMENEWQENNRGMGKKFRWSKQNADYRPIAVLLGNVTAGTYWKKEAEIVRSPQGIKITAADKEYIAEVFSEKPLLFVSRKADPNLMAITGFHTLIAQSGSLPHGKTNAEVLYERFGKQFLVELKEHSVHADSVLATEQWREARKLRMAELRKQNKTDKKVRANDAFRLRGIGRFGVVDCPLKDLQKNIGKGVIYLTTLEVQALKEEHANGDCRWQDFDAWVHENYEMNDVRLFAVSAKTAKEFAKMEVFESFANLQAKREARKVTNDATRFFTRFWQMRQIAGFDAFLDLHCAGDKAFNRYMQQVRKAEVIAHKRMGATNTGESITQDVFKIGQMSVSLAPLGKMVKTYLDMQEKQPFLADAIAGMRTWNTKFNAMCAEALTYVYPNRA